ncbi:LysR substrate-binding domain-containing protein [Chromobacterium violaceum]|uniref:LysR substrate-binding domain-containing protein n=1 Tax=Chromobacterium violaceum TaxID=536 RepID=UPI0009D94AEA|nr:LysR substrate-binding domain-containing protein [Chromobacterium violaceum]MBX9268934.1 LysR family transcriptional regulator [Chromobacterium violaceum]QRO33268.1 LysR family transcriptional regulator [Chromobacterium violaceum]QRQ16930.1 LysR family transcriptional regulator [Chromobacterium violaceum]
MKNIHPGLRGLDLNLLLLLDALFRAGSVQGAADSLAISASACSHALARLCLALGDQLFVRVGGGMRPTPRAEQLAPLVEAALALLSDGLARGAEFDPARSERRFVLAATDYTAFAVLPRFLNRMQSLAPALSFRVLQAERKVPLDALLAGSIDFALGYSEEDGPPSADIEEFDWPEEEYVAIASRDHPRIRGRLSLEAYLAERHAVVTPWSEPRGVVDLVLERMGLARSVALQLPSVLAAPFVIGGSELIMTLPRRAAQRLAEAAGVRLYPAPFAIPPYRLKLYRHRRHAGSAAHDWVWRQLAACGPEARAP